MSVDSEAARWQRLEALFYEALDIDPAARSEFLDRACTGDADLRREVEKLLRASEETVGFLHQPVREAARDIVSESGDASGLRIGAYRLIRTLGEGGMGRVYLAARADDQYQQNVAIKVMRSSVGRSPGMLMRFRAERQILANLNHPNIARLLDGGLTPDGLPYLVIEYVDGAPLDDYCGRANLSIDARLRLFRTICSAVEYAHGNLVVHRDIKPANILVASDGTPKLLDFGIAKLLDPSTESGDGPSVTRSTERLMTPEYASPEQICGQAVTTATDVYSLGTVLYELLTGRSPFRLTKSSPLETVRAICEDEPKRPSSVVDGRPAESRKLKGDLDNIVLKAMRKEPARRYASVAQFSEDVRRFLEGYPVEARSGTWRYRSAKFVRRHKAGVAAAAAMIAAIVAFGIGMGILARTATRERLTAQREAQFLESLFAAVSPLETHGAAITARELLDAGVKRIDRELAAEPAARAAIYDSVAESYRGIGLYDQGLPLKRKAYELRLKTFGENNLETAASLDGWATLLRLQGHYRQADPLFRRALDVRRKLAGGRSPLVAQSLTNLGECLFLEERITESIAVLRQALALDRQLGPDEGEDTRNYLALAVKRTGGLAEAAQLMDEAFEIGKRTSGLDDPDTAISLHNLASIWMDLGDYRDAESALRQCVAIRRKVLGNNHPDLVYSLNNLGWLLLAKGDWRAAEAPLAEGLAINLRQLGPSHTRLAPSWTNWGRFLQAKGDYDGAAKSYNHALDLLRSADQGDTWFAARIDENLARLQLDRGDAPGAERFARQALAIATRLGGDGTPDVADALIEVATALWFEGNPSAAEPLLRRALAIRKKSLAPDHPDFIGVQVRLGRVLLAEGKAGEAELLLRQALQSARAAKYPLFPWQLADAQSALADSLAALGPSQEAAMLYRASKPALESIPLAALRKQALAPPPARQTHSRS